MNAPPDTDETWVQVLDRLEHDVLALDVALADGEVVPVDSWVPPRDLGPLPTDLQPRARRLALHLAQLQSRTRERLGELSAQLHDVEQRRRAGSAYTA